MMAGVGGLGARGNVGMAAVIKSTFVGTLDGIMFANVTVVIVSRNTGIMAKSVVVS